MMDSQARRRIRRSGRTMRLHLTTILLMRDERCLSELCPSRSQPDQLSTSTGFDTCRRVVGRVTPVCAASCNGLLQRRARSDAPYLLSSVSLAGCGIPVYSAFGHKCPVQTRLRNFLLSLPERGARSATGLAGGLFREVGDLATPKTVRRSRLYRNLVHQNFRLAKHQTRNSHGRARFTLLTLL